MTINFNTQPYFDDYDETKNFHRVLFKPGVAVQARELTQLQTILQKQIERFGRHFFEEGSMVIPGQATIDTNIGYVKLVSASVIDPDSFVGTEITGGTSGVKARVVTYSPVSGSDPITFFVKYVDSGTSTTSATFSAGETLTGTSGSVTVAASSATGDGSIASIAEGVYFVKGNFVRVEPATIVLDKYSNQPTYRIGLLLDEQLVTVFDDASLQDNATGAYNYAAPGADRYKISATLSKLSVDSTLDQDFVELIRIENGEVKSQVRATEYSILEQTLARRTFDESGNYTVRRFEAQTRQQRDNNRGTWGSSNSYIRGDVVSLSGNTFVALTTSTNQNPTVNTAAWVETTVPQYNLGFSQTGSVDNLTLGLEPGKAYVQGYEIEKISTEFIEIPKARTTESVNGDIVNTNVGNYIIIRNLEGTFDITAFTQVSLRNQLTVTPGTAAGTEVGTARIRYIEHHSGTQGDVNCQYKVSLFDVTMNPSYDFNRDVKQLFVSGSTADIDPVEIELSGSITAAGTTVTGTGTKFLTQLKVGDYISANSNIRRVATITSDVSLTVSASLTVTGSTFSRVETQVLEPQGISLVFPLPQTTISNTSDFTIFVSQRYDKTPASGNIVIQNTDLPVNGTTAATDFVSGDVNDYIAIDKVTGNVTQITNAIVSGDGSQVTLTGFGSNAHAVYALVAKSLSSPPKAKVETVALKAFTSAQAAASTLSLSKADVYKIDRILGVSGKDYTKWYTLDNGQKPSYYGISKVIRKAEYIAPNEDIIVHFRYFAHTNTGDFFTRDSYAGISYEDIPAVSYGGSILRLSDAIDFRPRINDEGTGFTGGTSPSLAAVPFRNRGTILDYSYYLGRIDKLALDPTGRFFRIEGVPALDPQEPNDPAVGMVLYKLYVAPYTLSSKDIGVEYIVNKRYTMQDIGKLEKRIENVEYYTALSLLEQETKSLSIIDDAGLDRFKNGFLVDSFTGHNVGDVTSPDYQCSIDMQNGILRPFHRTENVNLVVKSNSNIQVTGDVGTLPYTSVSLVNQPYASRTENVNPYSIFTFIGQVNLNPQTDEWFEVDRRPDVVVFNDDNNFDAIKTALESSGALGTVWNSWQTQWTGTPSVVSRTQGLAARNIDVAADVPDLRLFNVTVERLATQVGQSRSGVRTTVVPRVDTQTISDRVVATAAIPFIRSRAVAFLVRRLKPNTTFYPFFDDTDVGAYVQPATKIAYSGSGSFDFTSNALNDADSLARRHNDNPEAAFSRGDVVTQAGSGATGVCVYQDSSFVYVVNVKGTFDSSNVITGSLSGASVTSTGVTVGNLGDDLVTNGLGDVAGVFYIPNTESIRFRTGIREFKLTTSEANGSDFKSIARGQYTASGVLETREASVASITRVEFAQERVFDQRTIIETTDRVFENSLVFEEQNGWGDPLAQTFLVEQRGGAFLTKVDLFFKTKDSSIPVAVEIREVVNGYPGKRILPFSRVVVNAADVNVSDNASLATTFTFRSPVYVQNNTEYALVIISDSNEYNVWIAQLGEQVVGSDRLISEQPYAGVLFKSQNASTWSADQTQDLKFNLYRAKFAPSSGSIIFRNSVNPLKNLELNPIQATSGQSSIRVIHPNHGLIDGDSVTISGFVSGNGLTSANVNGTFSVSNVLIDSYVVTTTDTASATGRVGGNEVYATQNYAFDVVQPIAQTQSFAETTIDYVLKTTDYSTGTFDSTGVNVVANENNYFDRPKVVKSGSTETAEMIVTFTTSNDSLSPVIDINRTSLIATRNRINTPSVSDYNYIDELAAEGGSAIAKYLTRQINFKNPSTFLKIQFAASVPTMADVEVYYKILPVGSATPLREVSYVQATTSQINKTLDENLFSDVECEIENLEPFSAVVVKLVMKSTNSSYVPQIKDLRVIACA